MAVAHLVTRAGEINLYLSKAEMMTYRREFEIIRIVTISGLWSNWPRHCV